MRNLREFLGAFAQAVMQLKSIWVWLIFLAWLACVAILLSFRSVPFAYALVGGTLFYAMLLFVLSLPYAAYRWTTEKVDHGSLSEIGRLDGLFLVAVSALSLMTIGLVGRTMSGVEQSLVETLALLVFFFCLVMIQSVAATALAQRSGVHVGYFLAFWFLPFTIGIFRARYRRLAGEEVR